MMRNTHCDIISRFPTVPSINIRPLDTPRARSWLPAYRTLLGYSKLPSEPIVKTTVADFITLPRIVSYTLEGRDGISLLLCSFMSFLKTCLFSSLGKFLSVDFVGTFSGTEQSSATKKPTWVLPSWFLAISTYYFYHAFSIEQYWNGATINLTK